MLSSFQFLPPFICISLFFSHFLSKSIIFQKCLALPMSHSKYDKEPSQFQNWMWEDCCCLPWSLLLKFVLNSAKEHKETNLSGWKYCITLGWPTSFLGNFRGKKRDLAVWFWDFPNSARTFYALLGRNKSNLNYI